MPSSTSGSTSKREPCCRTQKRSGVTFGERGSPRRERRWPSREAFGGRMPGSVSGRTPPAVVRLAEPGPAKLERMKHVLSRSRPLELRVTVKGEHITPDEIVPLKAGTPGRLQVELVHLDGRKRRAPRLDHGLAGKCHLAGGRAGPAAHAAISACFSGEQRALARARSPEPSGLASPLHRS